MSLAAGTVPSMALIGYARVSTSGQDPTGQRDALRDAGCVRVYTDRAPGAKTDRLELVCALERLEPGDALVVARLDRLGRSLPHLIEVVRELNDRGIDFRSLSESLDMTSAGGRLLFHIARAFAEFERDSSASAPSWASPPREQGRVGGRPRAMTPEKLASGRALLAERVTQVKAADAVGVSVRTLTRALATPPS